jgi:hypothetical protein
LLAVVAVVAALAIGGCAASGGGVASDAPLAVYLSVPLSGPEAAKGREVEAGAKAVLAAAGGKAGDHPLELTVLDDADTGGWNPVTAAANARRANEDASSIAYLGDLDEGATRTSLPITNLADIPQIVLSRVPGGIDVANLVDLPSGRPGHVAMTELIAAIERAGSDGGDRKKVLDELKTAAANQAAGSGL